MFLIPLAKKLDWRHPPVVTLDVRRHKLGRLRRKAIKAVLKARGRKRKRCRPFRPYQPYRRRFRCHPFHPFPRLRRRRCLQYLGCLRCTRPAWNQADECRGCPDSSRR